MKQKPKNPNAHKKIIGSLKRIPESTWSLGVKHVLTLKDPDAVWKLIQEMQQQNADHPEAMKKTLGRSYSPLMRYKPKLKKIGKTRVEKMPGDVTKITAPEGMQEKGLQRLLSSKKYDAVKQWDREVVKEGEQIILRWVDFEDLGAGDCFWYADPNVVNLITGTTFKWLRKVNETTAKNLKTEQVFKIPNNNQCLFPTKQNFSLTIKQIPGNTEVTQMATKTKKAAKKTAKKAVKKAAPKKAGEKTLASKGKDAGTISNIIALHKEGVANKDIIAKGFNKSTVGIQVAKFKRGESNYK